MSATQGDQMLHKTFQLIETKADGDDGTFEALVSVFGNVDSAGDRVLPGAFAKTLEQWQSTSDPIPVILSHQWNDPMAHIGVVYPGDAKETDRGLAVKGHLDVSDNEVAKQVHRLMKRRSLKEFSFGYRVIKETKAKDGANELHEVELMEVGPTLKGANPATELHAVKSAIEAEQQEPPSETELRKRDQEIRLAEETKDVPKGTEPAPDPVDRLAADFEAMKGEIAENVAGLKLQLEEKQAEEKVQTEAELRKKDQELRLAEATEDVSNDTPPAPDPVEQLHAKVDNLSTEFESFRTEIAKNLEGIKAAVEEPDRANSAKHDPLRKRSDQAVLEIQSDGISLRKSPIVRQEPVVEAAPEAELKARSRREMLELLTGVENDEE